jgi:two-component system, LuxR family, response regulator FixJ
MSVRHLVSVVDDDPVVCAVTARTLEATGEFVCQQYTSAEKLLSEFGSSEPVACVVTDLRMPTLDGAELQRRLKARDSSLSVIVVTAFADVKTAVKLMEEGANTIVPKPYESEDLVEKVRRAVSQTEQIRRHQARSREIRERIDRLSPEERLVLDGMLQGLPNKTLSNRLAMSPRTLDRRRQNILRTMEVESVAALAVLVGKALLPSSEQT